MIFAPTNALLFCVANGTGNGNGDPIWLWLGGIKKAMMDRNPGVAFHFPGGTLKVTKVACRLFTLTNIASAWTQQRHSVFAAGNWPHKDKSEVAKAHF
jgi:hypothetical protein